MRIRPVLTLAIPLACAALFLRLGAWQLSRLGERRAFNTTLVARSSQTPSDIGSLPPDTVQGHYRRVTASGTWLYDREVVFGGRVFNGSPGINFLTPLRTGHGDTVVMVNRGWAYSPDAANIDATRWHEKDPAPAIAGFAETYPATTTNTATPTTRLVRRLDRAAIERAVGLPVAPYLLVQTSDSALHADSIPVRIMAPTLDEGPHWSYAMQWLSFATIAVVGGVVLYRRQMAEAR